VLIHFQEKSVKRWMKIGGGVVAALVLLAGAAVFTGLRLAEGRMQRKVDVAVRPVAWATDAATLERGRYLFASRGCVDCHGANGGGRTFVEDGKGLRIKGPNISPGPGNVVAGYRPEDWVRAIRHGIAPSGRPLMVMPSEDYNRFTDADLGALVAYVRALPPVAGGAAVVEFPLPVRVLYGFGAIQDAAAKIDHGLPPAQPVAEGVNPAHGAYVANMCLGCHGAQLAGGRIPGGPPDWPAAPNLTPGAGTVMTNYADADALLRLFRSGKRPDGTPVQVMPFESLREMNETDVRALHLYLRSVQPRPQG
jgi:mono/diheme cytochrome c family protein